MINRILLPTDLSEASQPATAHAVELAKSFGAELHLLFVIEEPPFYAPLGGYYPDREQWTAFADSGLDNWISETDSEGLKIVREKVFGHPVSILEYAKGHDIDLIVVGTHGRGMLPHLMMGSVAENVVRQAKCPVLTVRPDQHGFAMP